MTEPITVVVATRDRLVLLMRTLAALHALPEQPSVIVVDDGSHDGTADAVRDRFPWANVVALAAPAGPAARNIGVTLAATDLVAFADDGSWYEPGSLAAAARAFQDRPRLGLVAGCVTVGAERRMDPTGVAMVVRREAFINVGGFDPALSTGGDEVSLARNLSMSGWELQYVPGVIAVRDPARFADHSERRRALARNAALMDAMHRRPIGAVSASAWRLLRQLRPSDIAGTVEGIAAGFWLRRRTGTS